MPIPELVAAANNPLTAAPAPLQEAIQRGAAIVSFPPASERGAVVSFSPAAERGIATTSFVYPPVAEVCACVGSLIVQSQVLSQLRMQPIARRQANEKWCSLDDGH